jgi:hypothetical protein
MSMMAPLVDFRAVLQSTVGVVDQLALGTSLA